MFFLGLVFMFGMQFNDVHSYGNMDQVRTTHLSLELALDFEKKVINGVNTLSLAYDKEHKGELDLYLDTRDLTVSSVADSAGKALRFSLGPDEGFMGQRLAIKLGDQRPEKVRIVYTTSPDAGAVQWLSPRQTSTGIPFLFTQSQAILARSWFPCMDSPGVRVTYDATIRVPKGMTVVMSARHGKHEAHKGIFNFEMPFAIPPYLIALAAGKLSFKAISDRTGVYAEPAVLEKAAWEFADMEKMVKAAEAIYGPYDWERWDTIVLPPSFPFGGMENPMLTFATPTLIAGDRSLVSVMAHELAHSWSGNLVTNATWADFWLNEGFTTYFERRIVEAIYGKDIADMQKLLGQRDLIRFWEELKTSAPADSILHIDLNERDPDEGFSDIPYEKGANFLLVLETHFGRKTFDAFLKKYFQSHTFKSITTEAFLIYLEKELFGGDKEADGPAEGETVDLRAGPARQHDHPQIGQVRKDPGRGQGLHRVRCAYRHQRSMGHGRVAGLPQQSATQTEP